METFEERMRQMELFSGRTVPEGTYPIIRLDGRAFTTFMSKANFRRPFDETFYRLMAETTKRLVEEFDAIYGYFESDEISLLFPRKFDTFGRRAEKLASLTAGFASGTLTGLFQKGGGELVPYFDSRAIAAEEGGDVIDYFRWRQGDAERCSLNSYAYYLLRGEGRDAVAASRALSGKAVHEKREILLRHGVDFDTVPTWQRFGSGTYWKETQKVGWNPISQKEVTVTRRLLYLDENLPQKGPYSEFLSALLERAGQNV